MGSKTMLVLLGAGRPLRGAEVPALADTGHHRRVLDWLLDAFRNVPVDRTVFIGGYRFGDVVEQYPEVSLVVNPNWESDGSVGSLLSAPLTRGEALYVSYSDIVYDRDVIGKVADADGDVVLGIDPGWRTRYAGRPLVDLRRAEKLVCEGERVIRSGVDIPTSSASGEFIGLCKLGPAAVKRVIELRAHDRETWGPRPLTSLIDHLASDGLDVRAVPVGGRWAELNAPQDLARFVLGSKAGTLSRLRPLVRRSEIPESFVFTVARWAADRLRLLEGIERTFHEQDLIVRSSSMSEDSWLSSNAGAFVSVRSVSATDPHALAEAIDKVIASYTSDCLEDEILVQPLVRDVEAAGVVMTRTAKAGGPYWVVNFDDSSGETDTVTSGTSAGLRTAFVHRSRADSHGLGSTVTSVVEAASEIEAMAGHDALDIEFATQPGGRVVILQVRPIVTDHGDWQTSDAQVADLLRQGEGLLERARRPGPFIVGDRPCFGIMPDWNPAEILGVKPRPLALSLYQHLITDEVWARQRAEFGYRDVRPCPLVVSFAGQPFVDVRASFNSFVPASLGDDVARRMVNHYTDRLQQHPELHDKVEFEIALTCTPLDFEDRAEALLGDVLSCDETQELRQALVEITSRGAHDQQSQSHLLAISELGARSEQILAMVEDPIDRAYLLLEDCRRLGTLAFSHLARQAFIAVEWLRSLGRLGVVEKSTTDAFFASLNTVTRQFTDDLTRVAGGALSWDELTNRYGHLRPGTYEIQSPCYADSLRQYLPAEVCPRLDIPPEPARVEWPCGVRRTTEQLLSRAGIPMSFEDFDRFSRVAIEGREYAKFVFTRNISRALEALATAGEAIGLDRSALAHLDVAHLLAMRRTGLRSADHLLSRATQAERDYQRSLAIELPPLLFSPNDLWAFEQVEALPSFISTGRVRGRVTVVDDPEVDLDGVDGSIALISSADPGYDWLFARDILGLVTAYGGTNSHMAIRAAERSLPAAIGVGNRRFEELRGSRVIELDCATQTIKAAV